MEGTQRLTLLVPSACPVGGPGDPCGLAEFPHPSQCGKRWWCNRLVMHYVVLLGWAHIYSGKPKARGTSTGTELVGIVWSKGQCAVNRMGALFQKMAEAEL